MHCSVPPRRGDGTQLKRDSPVFASCDHGIQNFNSGEEFKSEKDFKLAGPQ